MPKRKDVVAEQLSDLADDFEDLWRALVRDPAKEARKERIWTVLTGVVGAASTMASRRLVAKLWPILTGEQPPTPRMPKPHSAPPTQAREEEPAPTAR
jgi:hypothetical protein